MVFSDRHATGNQAVEPPRDRTRGGHGVPEARSPGGDPKPGHVHGLDRLPVHHRGLHRRPFPRGPWRRRTDSTASTCRSPSGSGSPSFSPTSRSPWQKSRARRGPTRCAPCGQRRSRDAWSERPRGEGRLRLAASRRPRGVRCGRRDPRGRGSDRRHRQRRRVGDHGGVRARHPGIRRGPKRGHGRHEGHQRPHRRAHHRGAGQDVRGPADRSGGERHAAEDARGDRPAHPALRVLHHLPGGRGHPVVLLRLQRRRRRSRKYSSLPPSCSPCWSASSRRPSAGSCPPSGSAA